MSVLLEKCTSIINLLVVVTVAVDGMPHSLRSSQTLSFHVGATDASATPAAGGSSVYRYELASVVLVIGDLYAGDVGQCFGN